MNLDSFNINNLTQDSTLLTLIAIAVLLIVLIIWIWRLERKIKKVLGGSKVMNIESSIAESHQQLKELKDFQRETLTHIKNMEGRIRRSIQTTETVRFNPFKGTGAGGNQSFSSAFLDEKGDGLVLSGLFLRERFSVYAKPLKNYQAEYELTHEEKETIEKAKIKIQSN